VSTPHIPPSPRRRTQPREYRAALIAALTARAEQELGIEDDLTEKLGTIRTNAAGFDAFSAGYQIAWWLVKYAAEELGRPELEIIRELALDSAAGTDQEQREADGE